MEARHWRFVRILGHEIDGHIREAELFEVREYIMVVWVILHLLKTGIEYCGLRSLTHRYRRSSERSRWSGVGDDWGMWHIGRVCQINASIDQK